MYYMYVCVRACVRACVRVCVLRLYLYFFHINKYIYIYIYRQHDGYSYRCGAFEQSHNLLQTPDPQTKLHQTNFLFTLHVNSWYNLKQDSKIYFYDNQTNKTLMVKNLLAAHYTIEGLAKN